jgi:hypothetical protein
MGINYLQALEQIEDAIWYMSQVIDTSDEDCQKILDGLQEASDTLTDCRNLICTACGEYAKEIEENCVCDGCRWRAER